MHVFNNSPLALWMCVCVCVCVSCLYVGGFACACVPCECAEMCGDVLEMAADGP